MQALIGWLVVLFVFDVFFCSARIGKGWSDVWPLAPCCRFNILLRREAIHGVFFNRARM